MSLDIRETSVTNRYEVTLTCGESDVYKYIISIPKDWAAKAKLASDFSSEDIVRASMNFLLDRESASEILPSFDLSIIEIYFPEYYKLIGEYLSAVGNNVRDL